MDTRSTSLRQKFSAHTHVAQFPGATPNFVFVSVSFYTNRSDLFFFCFYSPPFRRECYSHSLPPDTEGGGLTQLLYLLLHAGGSEQHQPLSVQDDLSVSRHLGPILGGHGVESDNHVLGSREDGVPVVGLDLLNLFLLQGPRLGGVQVGLLGQLDDDLLDGNVALEEDLGCAALIDLDALRGLVDEVVIMVQVQDLHLEAGHEILDLLRNRLLLLSQSLLPLDDDVLLQLITLGV